MKDSIVKTATEKHCKNYSNSAEILESLRYWSLDHNITRSGFSCLLKILKGHSCFENFPTDARTILQTPRTTITNKIGDGEFAYFGIRQGLETFASKSELLSGNVIHLYINIDGIPLFKSNNKSFWPILCNIIGTSFVFPIAIYLGDAKPSDLNLYLEDFVTEANELEQNQFQLSGKLYIIKIKGFICDAPARSFVCAIKNHNGYYGCGKCEVKGAYVQNRVVFLKTYINLRTNQSFRAESQAQHHLGKTPLLQLSTDIVDDFPYEYMHLVCLGVTKKLLKLWKEGKRHGFRLRPKTIKIVSEKLVQTRNTITSDFVRRPRSLDELDRWKATEFRTFLLYTGPVVLKGKIEEKYYHHFLVLSTAIRILAQPNQTEENISYSESLLEYFVCQFKVLYGSENVSYNVHGLIHLANDARKHGELDAFSAFKFENHLGKIKKLVRSANLPLSQISRRISELECLPLFQPNQSNSNHLLVNSCEVQIKFPNNIVFLKDKSILQIESIVTENNTIFVNGKKFLDPSSLFIYPCDSKLVDIYKVDKNNISLNTYRFNSGDILFKCVPVRKSETKLIIFPLLHSRVNDG